MVGWVPWKRRNAWATQYCGRVGEFEIDNLLANWVSCEGLSDQRGRMPFSNWSARGAPCLIHTKGTLAQVSFGLVKGNSLCWLSLKTSCGMLSITWLVSEHPLFPERTADFTPSVWGGKVGQHPLRCRYENACGISQHLVGETLGWALLRSFWPASLDGNGWSAASEADCFLHTSCACSLLAWASSLPSAPQALPPSF